MALFKPNKKLTDIDIQILENEILASYLHKEDIKIYNSFKRIERIVKKVKQLQSIKKTDCLMLTHDQGSSNFYSVDSNGMFTFKQYNEE